MKTEIKFTTGYLNRLAGIKTPPRGVEGFSSYEERCNDYCNLRNASEDLLRDENNTEAAEKISELVKKLCLEELK